MSPVRTRLTQRARTECSEARPLFVRQLLDLGVVRWAMSDADIHLHPQHIDQARYKFCNGVASNLLGDRLGAEQLW